MVFLKFLLPIFFIFNTLFCSSKDIVVFDASGKSHLIVDDNEVKYIYNDTLVTIFSMSGKRIYSKDTLGNPEIIFETRGKVFSSFTGTISNNSLQTLISFSQGRLFWGNTTNVEDYFIGFFEENEEGQTAFIDPTSGKPFFHFDTINIKSTTLLATALYFIQYYHLENNTINIYQPDPTEMSLDSINIVRITEDLVEYFYWDGKQLHNFSTGSDFNSWTFDGKVLYRTYYNTSDDWLWNGNELYRRWLFNEVYFKQGNSYIASNPSSTVNKQLVIQDNIIRPIWPNSDIQHIIEFKNNIPDAILMALAFGLIL